MEMHTGIAEAVVLSRSLRGWQDGRVEGGKLTPFYKNTKLTTNC